MTGKALYEAMTEIDPAYILSAAPMPSRSRKIRIQRWSALAACLCLILTVLGIGMCPGETGSAVYSAYDAAALFGAVNDTATKNYKEVSAPDADGLYLNTSAIPKDLAVYRNCGSGKKLDEKEFLDFADEYLPRAATLFGFQLAEIELEESFFGDDDTLRISQDNKINNDFAYALCAAQYEGFQRICFYSYGEYELFLNGEVLQIDQRESDGQIIASLSSVKRKLFQTFGVSFSDVKLIRHYDSYSSHGVTAIDIYFYNEKDHELNRYAEQPVSDCIILSFDNYGSGNYELCSDSVLTDASVNYIRHRSNAKKVYQIDGKVEALSIREAEKLLEKGYVFLNGHACRLCIESQEAVSFEDYDHVSLTYLSYNGYGPPFEKMDSLVMPFYSFYKEIGTGKNGNIIYAKTYVPAIPLEDMEEYFAQQQEKHRS